MAESEASRASELGGPGASTLSELIDQVAIGIINIKIIIIIIIIVVVVVIMIIGGPGASALSELIDQVAIVVNVVFMTSIFRALVLVPAYLCWCREQSPNKSTWSRVLAREG